MAVVDGVVLDASVVDHIVHRDGVDAATATAYAIDVLQWAADGAHSAVGPSLTPARRAQLLRAARARVWLHDEFEASHTPADIPTDARVLAVAYANSRFVHPALHRVCQVVVLPEGVASRDEAVAVTQDPKWQARARTVMQPLQQRLLRYIAPGDPSACTLMARVFSIAKPDTAEGIQVRYEKEAGFDLSACAQTAEDGSCAVPQFDEAWGAVIEATPPGQFTEVFLGSWGLHLAYHVAADPARLATDPQTEPWIREQVHAEWLAGEFAATLEQLQQRRAVRMVDPSAQEGAPPP